MLGLPSGKDIQKPAVFVPANASVSDVVAVNTTLYASTASTCGGAPNAVWAIDLDSDTKPVTSWATNGGSIVGRVAFTADGTLLAAIGPGQARMGGFANAIVALDPKSLLVKDWFAQPNAEFVTGPVVIQQGGKDLVAAATKDGRIILLNAQSLGGADHSTPAGASRALLGTGAMLATDALSAWQEMTPAAGPQGAPTVGATWLLASVSGAVSSEFSSAMTNGAVTAGAVVALKVASTNGALSLQPGWVSADLQAPATPIIVNGVVFALGTGKAAGGRAAAPAMLYAYDGKTGKALWNSQKAIAGPASTRSFWSALSQIYIGAEDGTVHAFGFLDERR